MTNDIFKDLIVRGGLSKNDNQLKLFDNIQFSMYPARAFAITLQRLYLDENMEYVEELGKIMGKTSAITFKTELKRIGSLLKKDYQNIPHLIEISGFGKINSFIENKEGFVLQINEHPVINPAKALYGEKSSVCNFYGQIYSEYIKIFQDISKLNIKHTKCICNGDKFCEWSFKK